MSSPLVMYKQTWETVLATLEMCTIRYSSVNMADEYYKFHRDGDFTSVKPHKTARNISNKSKMEEHKNIT